MKTAGSWTETIGFSVAAFGFFLPFFHYGFFGGVLGIQLTVLPFEALNNAPPILAWLAAFAIFTLPAMAAVAGLVYRRIASWNRPLIGLLFAAAGFVGLGSANFSPTTIRWDWGYYVVEAGFLIAAAGAAMRWVGRPRVDVRNAN